MSHSLEIALYVFGESYIDTFLDYCLPSLLTEKNRPLFQAAKLKIWTMRKKEVDRLSRELSKVHSNFEFCRTYEFQSRLSYSHFDFWNECVYHSDADKILLLIPDQVYAEDALPRIIDSLDRYGSVIYKGWYVLKEAIPDAILRNPQALTQNKIFQTYYAYAHPVNLTWLDTCPLLQVSSENIISIKDDIFIWQPINNHVSGINLKTIGWDKEKIYRHCNLERFVNTGKEDCIFIHNISLSLEDIYNQFPQVECSAPRHTKSMAYFHHLRRIKRPSLRNPEWKEHLEYDTKTQVIAYIKNPWCARNTVLARLFSNPWTFTFFIKLCFPFAQLTTTLYSQKENGRFDWHIQKRFGDQKSGGDEFFSGRREYAKAFSETEVAQCYLPFMRTMHNGFMQGTLEYLRKMVPRETEQIRENGVNRP